MFRIRCILQPNPSVQITSPLSAEGTFRFLHLSSIAWGCHAPSVTCHNCATRRYCFPAHAKTRSLPLRAAGEFRACGASARYGGGSMGCLTKQAAFRQPCRHGIGSVRLLKAAGPIQRQCSLQRGHPPSHSPHASAPWQQGCAACLQIGHLVLCGHMRAHARAAPPLRRQLAGCMHERPPHSLPAVPPVHHHVQHERRILHVRSHIRKLLWHHMLNNLYEATLGTILIAAAAQSLQDNADPARLPKMQHPCTILHGAEDL